MPVTRKSGPIVRRSVSLARDVDRKVQQLARRHSRSTASMLEALIQDGLQAREAERQRFFHLAERLRSSKDTQEVEQIKRDLARMTFGE